MAGLRTSPCAHSSRSLADGAGPRSSVAQATALSSGVSRAASCAAASWRSGMRSSATSRTSSSSAVTPSRALPSVESVTKSGRPGRSPRTPARSHRSVSFTLVHRRGAQPVQSPATSMRKMPSPPTTPLLTAIRSHSSFNSETRSGDSPRTVAVGSASPETTGRHAARGGSTSSVRCSPTTSSPACSSSSTCRSLPPVMAAHPARAGPPLPQRPSEACGGHGGLRPITLMVSQLPRRPVEFAKEGLRICVGKTPPAGRGRSCRYASRNRCSLSPDG